MNHTLIPKHRPHDRSAQPARPGRERHFAIVLLTLFAAHASVVIALWLRPGWAAALIGTVAVALAVRIAALRRRRRDAPHALPQPTPTHD